MGAEPAKPNGTRGIIHIVRQTPSGQTPASVFLLSFGGKKYGVGAFYIGRARGLDALAALLGTLGVSDDDADNGLQVLAAQPHHQIPNVTITREFLRTLGAADRD